MSRRKLPENALESTIMPTAETFRRKRIISWEMLAIVLEKQCLSWTGKQETMRPLAVATMPGAKDG